MSYRFFQNKQCEYFPCHEGDLNCLFCFCPLYRFIECGGSPRWIKGVKDCSECSLPHDEDGYDYIIDCLKSRKQDYLDDDID